jgi:hypothetical protein
MARIVADYMAESLQQAGVKRIYGVVGDSLNGFTDALRRRGAPHRRTRGLRGQLRPRQSASHQWAIRLSSQPRAGAGDRCPYTEQRDRH